MFEILLEPDGVPLDMRVPAHRAIRALLERTLRFAPPCRCAAPWLRAFVADDWREGRLRVSGLQACCDAQERAALRELPPAMIAFEARERPRVRETTERLRPPLRLRLERCQTGGGLPIDPVDVEADLRAAEGLSLCTRHDSLIVRGEGARVVQGVAIESLLLRALHPGTCLEEALRNSTPVRVVAYWPRYGSAWTPRSAFVAERLGFGVGGSFTGTLVRPFPGLGLGEDDASKEAVGG